MLKARGIADALVERRRALQVGEQQRDLADAGLVAGPQGRTAKRSRKTCSEITSGAVSASRVQVRSSISAASSKPASFAKTFFPDK